MNKQDIYLLGYAVGLAGADIKTSEGPKTIQNSPYMQLLADKGLQYHWQGIVEAEHKSHNIVQAISDASHELAQHTDALVAAGKFFVVVGGDHTSAIGTWSGVSYAMQEKGDIGLIWIDAHKDSHTPETSLTGRIHGMPLASLLGYGLPNLTQIMHPKSKIKPENVCLIGVRSFEEGEAELLKRLNVRVYYMEEVKRLGINKVLQEAIAYVKQGTVGYGISLDLDGIDPIDAPAVSVPEADGINGQALLLAMALLANDRELLGFEIVEFIPENDIGHRTEKLLVQLLLGMLPWSH
jgi:arginase